MAGNTAPDRAQFERVLLDRIEDLETKVADLQAHLYSLDRKYNAGRKERTAVKAMLKAYRTTMEEEKAKLISGPGGSSSAPRDQDESVNRRVYPFERRMHTLKDMAKNPSRPEASICEAYLDVEVSNFCSMYFGDDIETHITRLSRNKVGINPGQSDGIEIFRKNGRPLGKGKRSTLSEEDYKLAHLYILLNCDEMEPFIGLFDAEMCDGLDDDGKRYTRQQEFIPWFRQTMSSNNVSEETEYLHYLAYGPQSTTTVYNGYMVNGYRFRVHGNTRVNGTSNSGVSARINNDDDSDGSKFYGILNQVIELTFGINSVFLFRCSWFDVTCPAGIWTHPDYGLVELNPNRPYPGYDPFILAAQASQVYYAPSPGNQSRTVRGRRGWVSAFTTRARSVIAGFTSAEHEAPSDTEDHGNTEEVYQDMAPPALGFPDLSNADTSRIHLATGLYERVNDPLNDTAGGPRRRWRIQYEHIPYIHISRDSYQSLLHKYCNDSWRQLNDLVEQADEAGDLCVSQNVV